MQTRSYSVAELTFTAHERQGRRALLYCRAVPGRTMSPLASASHSTLLMRRCHTTARKTQRWILKSVNIRNVVCLQMKGSRCRELRTLITLWHLECNLARCTIPLCQYATQVSVRSPIPNMCRECVRKRFRNNMSIIVFDVLYYWNIVNYSNCDVLLRIGVIHFLRCDNNMWVSSWYRVLRRVVLLALIIMYTDFRIVIV